jgi:hypothetical protein
MKLPLPALVRIASLTRKQLASLLNYLGVVLEAAPSRSFNQVAAALFLFSCLREWSMKLPLPALVRIAS